MNILVIGSGAREHALVWKLRQSSRVRRLWCAPGNPGIAGQAECVPLPAADLQGLLRFAREHAVDLVVVGPEQPLALGLTDLFIREGLRVFGPTRAAARLESSKAFAKSFMQRRGIPTAAYRVFSADEAAQARIAVTDVRGPVVLKADGLAAGKGVAVCRDAREALPLVDAMLSGRAFGDAGRTLIVEEFLEGPEASVFAICDGERFRVLAPAQDHKRAGDGDTGKNTGGMGAFAPTPTVDASMMQTAIDTILTPTLTGMSEEGHPYSGCLYIGLMLTADGPKVVEYNCRLGDPETQVVLPLFGGDLADLLMNAAAGSLGPSGVEPVSGAAACVVLASEGYPDEYPTGRSITGLDALESDPMVRVFHAGTKRTPDGLVTSGGRVLCVTGLAQNGHMREAATRAYAAVRRIHFEGMHYRKDIAAAAMGPLNQRRRTDT
jgi:phosphoribosylamine--glycine ligase